MHVQGHRTLEQLQDLARAIPQKRIWRRFQAVILALQGRTNADIALALGCSQRAVRDWVARYNRQGPDALREQTHPGRPARFRPEDWPLLQQRLDAPPRPEDGCCAFRGVDVQRILEQEFGVTLSLQAVYDLLHRFCYSSLMPRPQHEESNPGVQAAFQEVVGDQIQAIAEDHPDQQVNIYFEDEARFGQQGTLTRVWARKGSRPRAVRQNGRVWLYVLVAACATTGKTSALIMPELNTAVINVFLEQFSRGLAVNEHAVLLWDGAGFHVSEELVVPSNVSLILLPPYAPELNPVENLWHYLRSHHWSNRCYRDHAALEAAAVEAVCAVCLDEGKVMSICAAPYTHREVA